MFCIHVEDQLFSFSIGHKSYIALSMSSNGIEVGLICFCDSSQIIYSSLSDIHIEV